LKCHKNGILIFLVMNHAKKEATVIAMSDNFIADTVGASATTAKNRNNAVVTSLGEEHD
jgi:hypothetical protein